MRPDELEALMAKPGRKPEDVFVQQTLERLLGLLGVDLPTDD